jgi:hypothetical protein
MFIKKETNMNEMCRRQNGSVLYTLDDNTINIYDRKGHVIIESDGRKTTFYSSSSHKPWKVVEKTPSGYRLKKRCRDSWSVADLVKVGDGKFDYDVSYPDLDGYNALNWCGSDAAMIDECKEAFDKDSLISWGEAPQEIWIKNKQGVMELLQV